MASCPVCGDSGLPAGARVAACHPPISCGSGLPFQLAVGGAGIIESAGIDYILPYWMARYYGLQESTVVESSAAPVGVVAPDSLGSIFGTNLASTTQQATSQPLPSSLGGVTLTVQDSAGTSASAPLLYVSPGQINFLMPSGLATGVATFTITNGASSPVKAIGAVGQVAPTLFSISGTARAWPPRLPYVSTPAIRNCNFP